MPENLEEQVYLHVLWQNRHVLFKRLNISTENLIKEVEKGKSLLSLLKNVKVSDDDYKEVEKSLRENVKLIPITSPEYPQELKKLNGKIYPPLLLYIKGKIINFNRCVAVLGTRNCSLYGRLNARNIAQKLASLNITVVTGFARGIDTEAVCGALEFSGKTVTVLPWLIPIYPPENERLSLDVINHGLLVSENLKKDNKNFLAKQQFYLRNRIISGMSKAVIVVETQIKSGTLYQVEYALKRGKRVFILKPEKDKINEGYNAFLNYNATPFSEISEIIDEVKSLASS